MALPPSYSSSARPQPSRLPAPNAGAGLQMVGEGLGAVGKAMYGAAEHRAETEHRIALMEDQRRQERLASDASARAIELDGRIRAREDELRAALPPGAEGVEEAMREFREKEVGDYLAGIQDPRVQSRFLETAARIKVGGEGRVRDMVYQARGEKAKQDGQLLGDGLHNRAPTDPAADDELALGLIDEFVVANGLVGDREKWVRSFLTEQHYDGKTLGLIDRDPQAALELLRSGQLDRVLLNTRDARIQDAETAINRRRVEAERQQSLIEAQQREQEDTLLATAKKGVAVDVGHLQAAAALAEARGDGSKALELREAAVSGAVTNAYQNAAPDQITRKIAEIEGQGDWQKNPALVFTRKALIDLRDQRRNAEPNITPPAWTDPASIARYEQEVRADAATRGITQPDYLSKDMVRALEAEMEAGPQGRATVLATIGRMSDGAAFAAARQLAPDDRVFQYAAVLEGRARSLALSGRDALATNKDIAAGDISRAFKASGGAEALRGFESDFGRAAQEAAGAIAAEMLRRQGKTRWDAEVFEEALHMTLGGERRGGERTGGLGVWRGAKLLLPSGMSQADFELRLSRLSGKRNAYAADGSQLDADRLRRAFRPVAVGDGLYHFLDAYGRPVRAKDGTPALLDIRSVP